MSARTAHGDLVAAAAQAFGDDGVSARSVEYCQGADRFQPPGLLKGMSHSSQVTFALFAHVSDEKNGRRVGDAGFAQRGGDREQGGDAGTIVRDARAV